MVHVSDHITYDLKKESISLAENIGKVIWVNNFPEENATVIVE